MKRGNDAMAALINRIGELERTVREAVAAPLKLPVLEDDPDERDPTNMWLFPDGRLRARHLNTTGTAYVYREWVPTSPGGGTSGTAPAPPVTAPTVHVESHVATWSQSYRQSGAARTDEGVVRLYYGSSGDPFNGRNQSLVGFDYATIAANLAGSTINSVTLRLQNLHSWYFSGVDIYFGIHNFTSEPATWAGGGIPQQRIVKHHFNRNQQRDVSMPLAFAQAIRDGWGKGIAIEAPDSNREFYGYAAGVGSGLQVPTLIINYTK